MTEPEAPQEPKRAERPKSKLSSFLSHPTVAAINLIAAIIGVVGLPLSFYFYYAAKEYPELSYYVSPARAVVVKAGQVSKLTTSYDNKVITTDITVAQVALWNAGSKTVRGADVLKPITIHVENTSILEATVRKTSREVVRFEMGTEELQNGRVPLSWNLLEPGDGGVVQLISAGDPNRNIYINGVIEGQPELVRQFNISIGELPKSFVYPQLALVIMLLVLYILQLKRTGKWFSFVGRVIIFQLLAFLLMMGFMFYRFSDVGPPFSF